jgi:large subunit ribosomal protein L25
MQIEVNARKRELQGTGASRRLRRDGKIPGIVYGGKDQPEVIELNHNELMLQLRKEAMHSSILTLNLDGQKQQVLLRAVNMHPWRQQVQHVDFQRVLADQKIHMKVPLHFVNAEIAVAVKLGGALVTHVLNEIDVSCLPADLPEFIEVDLKDIQIGQTVHLNDLVLPKGVEAVQKTENPAVAIAQLPRAAAAEETTETAAPAAAAVPAAKQPEKAAEAKKDDKKK